MNEETVPERPPHIVSQLYRVLPAKSVSVHLTQTGVDTDDVIVTIQALSRGSAHRFKWDTIEPYVEVYVWYGGIMRLKPKWENMQKAWDQHISNDAAEFAEYRRLKVKYQGRA